MGIFVKVGFMVLSLGLVIYAIQALKTPSEETNQGSAISILLGDNYRPFSWCPASVKRLEIVTGETVVKTLTTSTDLALVCEIMIGGVTQDQIDQSHFFPQVIAYGENDARHIIERSGERGTLFRTQGMTFTSPMLEKALGRHLEAH